MDTPFWRANKELRLAEQIQEKVAIYKAGLPVNAPITSEESYYDNFDVEFRNFWTNGSYYCIFAGLGLLPDQSLPSLAHRPEAVAGALRLFEEVKQGQQNLVAKLPGNYEYLKQLHNK
jgi:tryptophan halogenase